MASRLTPFSGRQMMHTNTYEIFRYQDDIPMDMPLHHHDFYEAYFFLSGNVQYIVESKSYLLTPGDILLIRPMELHQPILSSGERYERVVLWLNKTFLENFGMPDLPLSSCFTAAARDQAILLRPEEPMRNLLSVLLDGLIAETASQEYGHEACSLAYLAQILAYLSRLTTRLPQETEGKDSSSVVYRVIHYINEHCREELTLDCLSNRFFISKYHLSREFARVTGISVHRYLVQRRLSLARQMMAEGMSSTEVYQHCGFGDYSNFYRAFKNEYQMTPREYLTVARKSTVEYPRFFRDKGVEI